MAVFERDDDTIGLDVCGTVNGVCCKAWFALFAVRNDGRPGGLESSDGVRDSNLSNGVDCLPCNLAAIPLAITWINFCGRGMLPMGSVGMVISGITPIYHCDGFFASN